MERGFFTQREFEKAVEAGAFKRVILRASWKYFTVVGEMRNGSWATLVTVRDELRTFLNPAAGLAQLKRLGVTTVEVDLEKWDLEMTALAMRMRPDVTARRLRAKRIADSKYMRQNVPEPEEITREYELDKRIEWKVQRERLMAGVVTPPPKKAPVN